MPHTRYTHFNGPYSVMDRPEAEARIARGDLG